MTRPAGEGGEIHPYRIAYVAAITLVAISCDRVNSPIVDHQAMVSTSFRPADTTGVPSTVFHAGESIDMTCVVSNTSNVDVVFHQPSPAIVFRIGRGDSTVASSTDGLAFPLVIVNGILTSGNSITGSWRGPNTRGRIPQITLPAGTYTAKATPKISFDDAAVTLPADIQFTVIP